jgi:antitoxin VapB
MTLHIPAEAEQLARLAALRTGKTPEQIVREAIEARAIEAGVDIAPRRRTPEEIERRINEIAARSAALPLLDTRGEDEILGYNETGLPG